MAETKEQRDRLYDYLKFTYIFYFIVIFLVGLPFGIFFQITMPWYAFIYWIVFLVLIVKECFWLIKVEKRLGLD